MQISDVLVFPPRDYFNMNVSLESRKGMCVLFFEDKDIIHYPNVVRLWLIFLVSCSYWPEVLDLEILSDPAKSTRFNLDINVWPSSFFYRSFIIKTVWDLLLLALTHVVANEQLANPIWIYDISSEGFVTFVSVSPIITTPSL